MDFSELHFAHPLCLWISIVIPTVWVLYFIFYRIVRPHHRLENFIDSHLLPYLLVNGSDKKRASWVPLLIWSIAWLCLTLALAGPRWNFREMETFSRDQSLVILLDLSESMNATDIKPSRLVRAKQKIEDLINLSQDVKIGLIAFAADPHMITPVTEDKETIRHLLPSLETDLVHIQGSRLASALDMASAMLQAEAGSNKALLVISDGGFEDSSAIATAKKLAAGGIVIHAMGIGTIEGAPIKDHKGNIIKKNGAPVISKLEKERLSEISYAGKGEYFDAHYSDHDETVILNELEKRADAQLETGKKSRLWEESFYLLILPALPIMLWWFRKGYLFIFILAFMLPGFKGEAVTAEHYFMNSEQLGQQAMMEGDYETATNTFQDPFKRGVACYRAGNFTAAEKLFRENSRIEVASSAAYNLGNALVQQQKLKEAIAAYEAVLKEWPDHTKARDNLELVKKMLEQQQQQNQQQEGDDSDSDTSDQQSDNRDTKQNQDSQDSKDSKEQPQESDPQQPQQDQQNSEESPSETDQEAQTESNEAEASQNEQQEALDDTASKSQEEQDADCLLNRIVNDPKQFLKNKFYIESKKNGTTGGFNPW